MAGASGAILLASLFFPWYGQLSGWTSLALLDIVLAIVALAGLALLALEATRRPTAISVALAALTALVATLIVPWVIFRTLDVPAAAEGLGPRFAFLGLLATAGVALGAWLSMRDEGFGLRPGGGLEATVDRDGSPAEAEHVSLEQVGSRARGAP